MRKVKCFLQDRVTGEKLEVVVECNNLVVATTKGIMQAVKDTGKKNWKVNHLEFVGQPDSPAPIADIEKRMMQGKKIRPYEMRKLMMSPRFLSALHH